MYYLNQHNLEFLTYPVKILEFLTHSDPEQKLVLAFQLAVLQFLNLYSGKLAIDFAEILKIKSSQIY